MTDAPLESDPIDTTQADENAAKPLGPRKVTHHQALPANAVNKDLEITALSSPGWGGAAHSYSVVWPGGRALIDFQDGPIGEVGINGVTNEALLAIVADRLEGFRAGPYATAENEHALAHVKEALFQLHARTTDRILRGVEGTHEV